jgi:hypothetical protein
MGAGFLPSPSATGGWVGRADRLGPYSRGVSLSSAAVGVTPLRVHLVGGSRWRVWSAGARYAQGSAAVAASGNRRWPGQCNISAPQRLPPKGAIAARSVTFRPHRSTVCEGRRPWRWRSLRLMLPTSSGLSLAPEMTMVMHARKQRRDGGWGERPMFDLARRRQALAAFLAAGNRPERANRRWAEPGVF